MCLSCEDIARQSCAMVPRWRFLATFLRPVFSASHLQQVSDLHLKFTRAKLCWYCISWSSPVFLIEQYLARAAVDAKPEAVNQHSGVAEHDVSAVRPLRVYRDTVAHYSLRTH